MKSELSAPLRPTTVDRPSWDEYFMGITRAVSSRATCSRRSVGAAIVKDKRILSTGYNGAPVGLRHCNHENGGDLVNGHCARSTHAEQNAIVQAARHGTGIDGGTMYCTDHPCLSCAKLLINAGIKRVVYGEPYPDDLAVSMFAEAGVALEHYAGPAPATERR